jgi:hypothetical protein
MKHLFILVGLPWSGKTTTLKTFCNSAYSFEYFTNDAICRQVMDLFGISPYFSVADEECWDELDKHGNVDQAKYWFYVVALLRLTGDVAFSDGYLYYFQRERDILEAAVKQIWQEDYSIHYLHLNPPLEKRNQMRQSRNLPPITEEYLQSKSANLNLDFFETSVCDEEEFARYVAGVIGPLEKRTSPPSSMWVQWIAPSFGREAKAIDEKRAPRCPHPKDSFTRRLMTALKERLS